MATLQLAELSRALGVAVSDIDLHSPIGAAALRDLRHASRRHKLLLFCDRELDDDERRWRNLAMVQEMFAEFSAGNKEGQLAHVAEWREFSNPNTYREAVG